MVTPCCILEVNYFFLTISLLADMWNPFEVFFKQRLKLALLAVKMLPTPVPYLFLLICVSNGADNLCSRWMNSVH